MFGDDGEPIGLAGLKRQCTETPRCFVKAKLCRFPSYEPAVAICITTRRAVYIGDRSVKGLKGSTQDNWPVEYRSYDFRHPLANLKPTMLVPGGPKIYSPFTVPNTRAPGQIHNKGDDITMDFQKGGYTYRLSLGHSETSPHGDLEVLDDQGMVQKEDCVAYAFEASLKKDPGH